MSKFELFSIFYAIAFVFFLVGETLRANTYRRWYLMCRNELEKIDPVNPVLIQIGTRTSKKEKWENGS